DADFCNDLVSAMARRREIAGHSAIVLGSGTPALRRLAGNDGLEPKLIGTEQSNTSVVFGDQLLVKLIRRLEDGENPELEVGRALTQVGFAHASPVLGSLEYRGQGRSITLAVAQGFVPNEGDAWSLVVDQFGRFFEEMVTTTDPLSGLSRGPDLLADS